MNNNARYDRSTNFLELEVNVPRTIGILTTAKSFSTKENIFCTHACGAGGASEYGLKNVDGPARLVRRRNSKALIA